MQDDGNFVVYTAAREPVWATMTFTQGARFVLQNDGTLAVVAPTGAQLWTSGVGFSAIPTGLYYPIRITLRSTSDWADLTILNAGTIRSATLLGQMGNIGEVLAEPGHLWLTQPIESAGRGQTVTMTVELSLSARSVPERLRLVLDKGDIGLVTVNVEALDGQTPIPLAHIEHALTVDDPSHSNRLPVDVQLAPLDRLEPQSEPK